MKFSFESQQYRDNLAQEIVDKPKPERKALLEEKRKTLQFTLAEHIRDFTRKNNKKGGEDSVEGGSVEANVENREIVGKDGEGKEYKVNIEVIDITNEIPESVKIIYDMNRLLEIEYNYRDEEVSRGWHETDNTLSDREKDSSYINRDKSDPVDAVVGKYLQMVVREKSENLVKGKGVEMVDFDPMSFIEQAKIDFAKFREKITEGMVSNPNVFYHTIGAYTEGFKQDWYDGDTMISKEAVVNNLRNRFPNDSRGTKIEEIPLEINADLVSDGLYVHSGKLIYDNPFKALMLIDGRSHKFQEHFSYFLKRKSGEKEDVYFTDEALEAANTDNQFGIKLIPKDSTGVHWLRVAEQIFDPYHGRLIKITNAENF